MNVGFTLKMSETKIKLAHLSDARPDSGSMPRNPCGILRNFHLASSLRDGVDNTMKCGAVGRLRGHFG